jgi:hypothetical protein
MTESPFRAPAIRPNEVRYWTFGGLPKGRSPLILYFTIYTYSKFSFAWVPRSVDETASPLRQFLKTYTGNVLEKK